LLIGDSLPIAAVIHLAGLVVFGMTFALLYGWAHNRIEHG
jgi:hypothetical protein